MNSYSLKDSVKKISEQVQVSESEVQDHLIDIIKSEYLKRYGHECEVIEEGDEWYIDDNDSRISLSDLPLSLMANIRSRFVGHIGSLKYTLAEKRVESLVGTLIPCTIIKIYENSVLVETNSIRNVFPIAFFMPNDILEVGKQYLFLLDSIYRSKNKMSMKVYRNNIEFIKAVVRLYIPEIESGSILLKSVYRVPRINNFIIISSSLKRCISYCMGLDNSRIKCIVKEISGESVFFVNDQNDKYYNFKSIFKIRDNCFLIHEDADRINVVIDDRLYDWILYNKQAMKVFEITYNKSFFVYNFKQQDTDFIKDIFGESVYDFDTIQKIFDSKPSFMMINMLFDRKQVLDLYSMIFKMLSLDTSRLLNEEFIEKDISISDMIDCSSASKNKKAFKYE